ncbi:hypothetical protein C8Q75DRAFT_300378 [Abortiporus biennis]|nr:hypothetical protein C8Q75DRAFT_300378 [Abortiporus biennis]
MGRRKKAAEPESESEEEQFHVEVITKARVNEDGDGWEYFVKWANYPPSASTWEPEENVAGCDRLLASFWEHVGVDNKDYTAGHEIPAEAEWIEKEKKFFKKHFTEDTKSRDKGKGKAKAPEPSPSPEPTKKRGRKSSAVQKKTSTSAISDASKRTRKRTRVILMTLTMYLCLQQKSREGRKLHVRLLMIRMVRIHYL